MHTSYLTGVAWMSHTLRFVLHPGFQDPGTAGMSEPAQITTSQLPGLLASFNGGFKLKDAQGGYYDHGHTVGTLVAGAASFVVYKDGHATVGTWGSDVTMTPDVAFVRQNLAAADHRRRGRAEPRRERPEQLGRDRRRRICRVAQRDRRHRDG